MRRKLTEQQAFALGAMSEEGRLREELAGEWNIPPACPFGIGIHIKAWGQRMGLNHELRGGGRVGSEFDVVLVEKLQVDFLLVSSSRKSA